MIIKLKTKINFPERVQTESYLALPTNGRRGVCVAFFDPDELDYAALEFAKQLKNNAADNEIIYAADVGCSSYFPQAIRFAQMDLRVDAFDIESPIPEYHTINHELNGKINYFQANLRLPLEQKNHRYSIVYSNRFMSHLTFSEAKNILHYFIQHATKNCRFYLSFGSLTSYQKDDYSDGCKPVEERFARISGELATKHQLMEPVCLYTKDDIYGKLLADLPVNILAELKGSVSIKIIFSLKK